MFPGKTVQTAKFDTRFFPQHLLLLSVGENLMPMGYWTVISKDPFRFLICMGVGNHSLLLLKNIKKPRCTSCPGAGASRWRAPAT